MRHVFAVCILPTAALLAACNPPVDTTPGELQTFDASNIVEEVCRFANGDRPEDTGFAVDVSEGGRAYVRFKGETLKLSPTEPLTVADDDTLSGRYGVIDYPRWELVVTGRDLIAANMPRLFNISIQLLDDGNVVSKLDNLSGRCAI